MDGLLCGTFLLYTTFHIHTSSFFYDAFYPTFTHVHTLMEHLVVSALPKGM